jgi:hypothetical protein
MAVHLVGSPGALPYVGLPLHPATHSPASLQVAPLERGSAFAPGMRECEPFGEGKPKAYQHTHQHTDPTTLLSKSPAATAPVSTTPLPPFPHTHRTGAELQLGPHNRFPSLADADCNSRGRHSVCDSRCAQVACCCCGPGITIHQRLHTSPRAGRGAESSAASPCRAPTLTQAAA